MSTSSAPVPSATSPEEELAALMSQVTALSTLAVSVSRRCIDVHDKELSKSALDMAHECIDINAKIPRIVRAHVDAAVAAYRPSTPVFFEHEAETPDEMDDNFPAPEGENRAWYVVCFGRHPGLYADFDEADNQVRGIPGGFRRRVVGRAAALAYYRQMYNNGKVTRMSEELPHGAVLTSAGAET